MTKFIDQLVSYGLENIAIAPWRAEHVLVAARPIDAGEVILTERPLVSVPDDEIGYPTFSWALVDSILASASITAQFYSLQLHQTKFRVDMEDQKTERELSKKYRRSRDVIRKIYMSVTTNNVGYGGSVGRSVGHGIYPIISRANHSCAPNAAYNSTDITTKEVSLVALSPVATGEPVTWNYAGTAEFDASDYVQRNFNLVDNFRFACACPKCQLEMPVELASKKDLVAHFDELAKAFIKERLAQMLADDPTSEEAARLQGLVKTTRFSLN